MIRPLPLRPLLTALVIALAAASMPRPAAPLAAEEATIAAPRALAAARSGERLLIDVRSPAEWRRTGLPAGAEAVSIHHPDGLEAFLEEVAALAGDRDRPLALICAGGVRSARAAELLRARGFSDVADVGEGMLGSADGPGWLGRGLPTEPCGRC